MDEATKLACKLNEAIDDYELEQRLVRSFSTSMFVVKKSVRLKRASG